MRAALIATAVALGLFVVTGLAFPDAFWRTFISKPPAITSGFHASDWEDDDTFTAAVFRDLPGTRIESGLLRELSREGFTIQAKDHAASYYWSDPRCEKWLYLEWQTDRTNEVWKITHGGEAGCSPS